MWITRIDDGLLHEVNAAFLSLFGLQRAEAVGHTSIELKLWVKPEDRSRLVGALLQTRRIVRNQVRMRSTSSEEFTLTLSGVIVRWRGEDAILAVGTLLGRVPRAS